MSTHFARQGLSGAARPIGTIIAVASVALLILPFFSTNRMRYYAPAPFAFLEWLGRTFRFGPYAFKVSVGEMEAWAHRES